MTQSEVPEGMGFVFNRLVRNPDQVLDAIIAEYDPVKQRPLIEEAKALKEALSIDTEFAELRMQYRAALTYQTSREIRNKLWAIVQCLRQSEKPVLMAQLRNYGTKLGRQPVNVPPIQLQADQ